MSEPNPCAVLSCPKIDEPVETCRDHRCPHRWQREGREMRERDEERDRREREEAERRKKENMRG
jgi:hypothetical protein